MPAPSGLIHEASLKTETREVPAKTVVALSQTTVVKSADRLAAAAKPADKKSADKPGLAAAQSHDKKSVDKPIELAARAVTKPVRIAKNDPLAPLPDKRFVKTAKEPAPAR